MTKRDYRLVCSDIDGTILNSQGILTERTRKAILALKQQGIPVVLVSARPPQGISCFYEALWEESPPVCAYSGGYIVLDGQVVFNRTIPLELTKQICDITRRHPVHTSLYQAEHWYVEAMDKEASWEAEAIGFDPEIAEQDKLFEEWTRCHTEPNKLLCIGQAEEISRLQKVLLRQFGTKLNISLSKATYLEIMPLGVTKAEAVKVLCSRMGIVPEQMIAFGDHFNDLAMLREAGLGIAMGNSPAEIQRAADMVAKTNDEDGVAEILERLFL